MCLVCDVHNHVIVYIYLCYIESSTCAINSPYAEFLEDIHSVISTCQYIVYNTYVLYTHIVQMYKTCTIVRAHY